MYRNLGGGPFRAWLDSLLRPLLANDRKNAGLVNREFLDWLSHRREPLRPFFAFLNYFDAHSPYLPPEGAGFRFGLPPQTDADFFLLNEFWTTVDKQRLTAHNRVLVQDSYDNCLGYLDEQLGELFKSLEQVGVLDRTLVVVTADHGEELGEHALFDHGESLYRPEIRVPLLFVLPSGSQLPAIVRNTVSLRDLPATIVELVGLAAASPFPGRSLASLWYQSSQENAGSGGEGIPDGAISELWVQIRPIRVKADRPHLEAHWSPWPKAIWFSFETADGTEELFNERDDPRELVNRAGIKEMKPVLQRIRQRLDQMRASPSGAIPLATRSHQ